MLSIKQELKNLYLAQLRQSLSPNPSKKIPVVGLSLCFGSVGKQQLYATTIFYVHVCMSEEIIIFQSPWQNDK